MTLPICLTKLTYEMDGFIYAEMYFTSLSGKQPIAEENRHPFEKDFEKKKTPWKVVGRTFCLSLFKDKDYQIFFFFHCQVRQLATV